MKGSLAIVATVQHCVDVSIPPSTRAWGCSSLGQLDPARDHSHRYVGWSLAPCDSSSSLPRLLISWVCRPTAQFPHLLDRLLVAWRQAGTGEQLRGRAEAPVHDLLGRCVEGLLTASGDCNRIACCSGGVVVCSVSEGIAQKDMPLTKLSTLDAFSDHCRALQSPRLGCLCRVARLSVSLGVAQQEARQGPSQEVSIASCKHALWRVVTFPAVFNCVQQVA